MRAALIVVAAGSGVRLGLSVPKALAVVGGQTLVHHAVARGRDSGCFDDLVVAAPVDYSREFSTFDDATVVAGGATRAESVRRGLASVPNADIVLVHDAARPLAPSSLFTEIYRAVVNGADAVVPGVAVVDTIKEIDAKGRVVATPDREVLRAIQTPQGFRADVLRSAHEGGADATDDAALVERVGATVVVVPGSPLAFKITHPADLRRAADLLAVAR